MQNSVPIHIAIIMDGNRRWAKERGLPIMEGHRRVATRVLEPLIEHAAKRGIRYVTLWVFSTENWHREAEEVRGILSIFRRALTIFGMRMHKKGIRILAIGDLSRFDADIRKSVRGLIELTKNNTRITVIFALNYGGRDEILRAIEKLHASSKFKVQSSKLSEENFSSLLDTSGIPDPDLIVRTSGEKRLSGFLMWQSAYSEFIFPAWYMPEFTPERLDEVIEEYNRRSRRYGR
jgi:undecaprenyl diphosphate synthase